MEGVRILSIAELLDLSRPLSGAASLRPGSSSPTPPKRSKLDDPEGNTSKPPVFSPDQNPNSKGFSPLGRPVLLIGTVDLFPCDSGRSFGCLNHCFSFSDGSSRVCCYLLDFGLKVIGREIHVLAWNFLPFKHESGGVLEVIRWSIPEFEMASHCHPSLSISSACSSKETDSKACGRALGILRAVSPIFSVPCVKEREDSQKNSRGILMDSGDAIGFLAEILTCACGLCGDSRLAAEHENNCHSFTNSAFIYFIKPTFLWRPVLFRLIGKLIMVSWLKRKLVFVGSEDSYLMFVSTALTVVSLSQLPLNVMTVTSPVKSDEGVYNGVVTGIYMQGMVVELDGKVWLLITDRMLAPQHSLRVGAIVSVRNFHLVHVKYSWLKIFLLGTCFRTCICINSFSINDVRFHFKSETESLLEKFIESLKFSAKFWMLLLVSCFKKKFTGILPHKDILGSKKFICARCHQKEGFIQTFATRCLPPSAAQVQPGLFMNFLKHNRCCYGSELNLSLLKLVIPISNLTNWCESIWVSIAQKHCDAKIVGRNQYLDHILHRGTFYEHMVRRIIPSDETGFILMGTFKISPYSGRLQLTDATGSIDVVVPDLPLDVDFQTVYEVKDYKLVLEGSPTHVGHLQCHFDGPLSCRAIFQQFSHKGTLELAVYVHFYLRDSTCISFPPKVPSCMDKNSSFKCSNGEMFHMLLVTHTFPVYQSLHDDLTLPSSSSLFAEGLILPYNLIPITNENGGPVEVLLNNLDNKSDCIGQLKNITKGWSKDSKQSEHVHISRSIQLSGSANVSVEFGRSCLVLCSLAFKSRNCQWPQLPVYLHIANEIIVKDILHNQSDSRVLLEFRSDSFSNYQMLRVGSYYLLKCSKKGLHCRSKVCEHMTGRKSLVISETSFWSLSFSFGEEKHLSESSGDDCSRVRSVRNNEVCSKEICHHELMFLQFFDQSYGLSDVYLHIPTEAIRQLEEINPTHQGFNSLFPSLDGILSVSGVHNTMAEVAMPPGISDLPMSQLPQGNQISLNGNIENVSIYDCKPESCVSCSCMAVCSHWSVCKVCIYVNDDEHMVRIRGNLSRYACPVGLGPGANATFHRVLLTRTSSICHELVLTPMSLIVINSVKELVNQHNDRSLIQESRWNIQHEKLLNNVSLGLISQMLQCMDSKLIWLHCRVVTIIMLVLEFETYESMELQSARYFKTPTASIPLAGFLLDDGSSLCACWADYGRAETLLRLHETTQKAFFSCHEISKVYKNKNSRQTVGYHLQKMLKKHHKIIVRNHGATPDLSCEDLTFSFHSNKVFSNTEERLLRFIILNACHASIFNVAGNTMDSNALFCANMEFLEYHQALQSMPHLRVREVGHVDPKKEARNIWNDLCMG